MAAVQPAPVSPDPHADAAAAPRAEYLRRLVRWQDAIARTDRRHLLVSNLRLVAAAAAAVAFVVALRLTGSMRWDAALWHILAWLVLPLAAFAALAAVHARVLERGARARRAVGVYERGLARLDGRWSGTGPDGGRFLAHHPYGRDLDLFGSGSLFQLIDMARTAAGEDALADWLGAPAPLDEARARQLAVDELRGRLELREQIAVLGDEARVGDTGALASWAAAAPTAFPRALAPALTVAGAGAAAAAALVAAGALAGGALVLWLLLEAALVVPWRRRFRAALADVEAAERDLGLLAGLLERIEREPFSAPRLTSLQAALAAGGGAHRAIARLRRLVSLLESSRHNLLFAPLTAALLVPQQIAIRVGRWHREHGNAVPGWIRAAGELEALSSVATYAFEHPADPFPVLQAGGPTFDAVGLAHPLIPAGTAVPNDVALGGPGPRVLIVSGSNMSGKSTLLRAVGTNAVLALMGAPVRARRLELSLLTIGATIRVEDSLQEGHSRFYTEILRIRDIVGLARERGPVLFLLDEILHGTNSHDRRIGAEAIARSLVEAGAIGLITTHDLALTELPSLLGERARNVHFEDRIEQGRMRFDYRMHDGVVTHSNALALMRAVGLDV